MKKKLVIELSSKVETIVPPNNAVPAYPGERSSGSGSTLPALRAAVLIKDSHFARLWKYLYEPQKPIVLTDFEEDMRKRLQNMWQLLTGKILNDRKAVLAHVIWCKDNCMEITERTAYDDVRRAKALFGDPRTSAAVFEKKRISEMLLSQIELLRGIQDNPASDSIDKIEASKAINQVTRRYNAVNGLEENINTQVPRAAIAIMFNADPKTLLEQAKDLVKDVEYTEFEDLK